MKILLIGNYVNDNQKSMQRFSAMLEEHLCSHGHDVRILKPPVFFGRIIKSAYGIGKWLGYVDKLLIFPFVIRRAVGWANIVHVCDHSNAIYTKYLKDVPHLVTCHDMLAVRSALGEIPENITKWSGRILQRMILRGLMHARHIICVSESTKIDVLRLTSISPSNMSVIYNGLNYNFSPMTNDEVKRHLENAGITYEAKYLLHVGGNQWYKNRIGVLKIFHEVIKLQGAQDYRLIMVGEHWSLAMKEYVRTNQLSSYVMELTNVGNESLRALYTGATALLYPSLFEGFGWPIVEAQACGCPVFTTNRPPMTEVGGDAAIYIDPEKISETGRKVTDKLNTLMGLREAGFRNAKRFLTSRMISEYEIAYESLFQGDDH